MARWAPHVLWCHCLTGFVESFNISVAAALIMYEAQQQRVRKLGSSGDLTERQQQQLLAAFLMRGVVSMPGCIHWLCGLDSMQISLLILALHT